MTETRLRTWTHSISYGLSALFITALAFQNLRYGFYQLFYLAVTMTTLLLAGLVYTILCRRQQLAARGHLIVLIALNSGLVTAVFTMDAPGISHWAAPLILLNLLILPLRLGLALSVLLLLPVLALAWLNTGPAPALITSAGLVTLTVVAALYVWQYDHMAQSPEDLAITDPITGAHNARFLDETLQKEISRAIATGHSLSVISLSIDHATEIQDLHGKNAIQSLMQKISAHLFEVIRAGDSLYSVREREFFLILPFTPEDGVRVIAERIRRAISERHWPAIGTVSVSLGCTTRGNADTNTQSLRARAEKAMTEARQRGADVAWYIPGEPIQA
jgi:diguanylate cyclase (GGDEF)-like protein